jgi:hypothetical protein
MTLTFGATSVTNIGSKGLPGNRGYWSERLQKL